MCPASSSSSSSSWPWMKDSDEALTTTVIDPIVPEDDRRSIYELMDEHRLKIDKIKESVSQDPLYNSEKHDDLWILRFWLSHKKSKSAIDAAKQTLQFRSQYKLDERDIRDDAPHKLQDGTQVNDEIVHKYWQQRCPDDALVLTLPHKQRGVVWMARPAKLNNAVAVDTITKEEWEIAFIYSAEWCFQWSDYVTRTTGRLTKSVRLVDMTDTSLSSWNSAAKKRDSDIMKRLQDCYPQMLETIKVCNAPTSMNVIWGIVRPLLPERILNKVDVINPKKNEKDQRSLHRFIAQEQLPEAFGGSNELPPIVW